MGGKKRRNDSLQETDRGRQRHELTPEEKRDIWNARRRELYAEHRRDESVEKKTLRKASRHEQDLKRSTQVRAEQPIDEQEIQNEIKRVQQGAARAGETAEKHEERKRLAREHQDAARAGETAEESEERKRRDREQQEAARARETAEEHEERKRRAREQQVAARERVKRNLTREEVRHRNATCMVADAVQSFYDASSTNREAGMNAEACKHHITDQTPTDDDQLRMYDDLVKLVGGLEPRRVCAVCCRAGNTSEFKTLKVVSQLYMLRAENINPDIVPDFADPNYEHYKTRTTVDGIEYALDPRFVSNPEGAPDEAAASVCETCFTPILARGHKAPLYSLLNGFDYCDVKKHNLPEPNLGEQIMLASVHLFANRMTFSISGKSQDSVTGNFISFATDAPFKAAEGILGRVQMLKDLVTVQFVGTQQQFEKHRSDIHANVRFRLSVRVSVLMTWFRLLKAVHPLYSDLELGNVNEASLENAVQAAVEDVVAHTEVLSSESAIAVEKVVKDDAATDAVHEASEAAAAGASNASTSTTSDDDTENAVDASPIIQGNDICVVTDPERTTMGLRKMGASVLRSLGGFNEDDGDQEEGGDDEEAEKTAHSQDLSESDGANQPVLNIQALLEKNPVNEYEDNHNLLGGAFPWLFPFGLPSTICGPLSRVITRGMQLHYSRRMGRSSPLGFLLFNQLQRSQVARATAIRVRASPQKWARFVELLQNHEVMEELADVVHHNKEDPSTELSTALADLLNVIKSAALEVTYAWGQRSHARVHLRALAVRFGTAANFVTVSPNATDSRLLMRLADPDDVPGFAPSSGNVYPPSRTERANRVTSDPSAAAIYFEAIEKALADIALGLPYNPTRRNRHIPVCSRNRGVLGQALGYYGVNEAQSRLMLHVHILFFGGVNRTAFDQFRNDFGVRAAYERFLDATVSARIDQDVYNGINECTLPRPLFTPADFESETLRLAAIRRCGQEITCKTGLHCHSATCRKGNHGCCRVNFGRNPVTLTRLVQIHAKKPDGSASNHEEEAAEKGTLVSDYQGLPYHTFDQYCTTDVEPDYPYSRQVRTLKHHVVPLRD